MKRFKVLIAGTACLTIITFKVMALCGCTYHLGNGFYFVYQYYVVGSSCCIGSPSQTASRETWYNYQYGWTDYVDGCEAMQRCCEPDPINC